MTDITHVTPFIGDTVHYVQEHEIQPAPIPVEGESWEPSKACRAATVTEVDDDDPSRVGLAVVMPTAVGFVPLAGGGSVFDGVAEPKTERGPAGRPLGSWHPVGMC